MQISWDQKYAKRTQRMKSSAIRELLKITEEPDVISFAGGLPAPEVFPVEKFAEVAQKVLSESGPQALQYAATEGYRPLRELLAQLATQDGVTTSVENILITTGSQQALDLLGKILIDPGDFIVIESPTYMGTLQAWSSYGAEYLPLPSDDQGMILDSLEELLQRGPKAIYSLPNFQNPSGRTLSLERRHQLVDAARRYGIPILEDDAYARLRFEGEFLPSLQQVDSALQNDSSSYQGNVVHLSTFSKVLSPGLRLGWVIAPPQLISKLVQAKQGTDLHTPTFTQMIAYEMLRDGFIEQHIPIIRETYRIRRDAMLEALAQYFPPEATWTHPEGGMFLWITLPEGIDTARLLQEAVEKERVACVPGAAFHPCGGGDNTMRLNFSNSSPEKIREGIKRLARVLSSQLATSR